jgi:acetolactate synthase-1/2/3 large subunit
VPILTGGEALVRMLQAHGVELAFGMGGFQPLPYYDALARQDSLNHVLIRDEKDGAFAADAYARIANRPAVADATLGPGATNLVSGAAESFGASVPLLLITGEVNSLIAGRAATQESDQFGMLAPTSKLSIPLDRIERIPELVRRAVSASTSGRPGPVHLNINEEVYHGSYDFPPDDLYADPDAGRVGARPIRPSDDAVERAAAGLAAAERPVLIVGGGIHFSAGYAALASFAAATGIPVATTISGKGAISERDPLAVGVCGRFSRFANDLIAEADVLLVVGSKLGEIATNRWSVIPREATLIHVDIDPEEIGKIYRTEVGLWGDAGATLAALEAAVAAAGGRDRQTMSDQQATVDAARKAWATATEPLYHSPESPLHMARVLAELREALPADGILVADGGFAAHWSALLFDVLEPGRSYIANRGHAAIGYALPGAIGAKLAAPDRPVVALCGDNGFAMAIAELETAKRVGAPVLALVVDNATLGYVKALQHAMYDDRFQSVDFLDVDYGEIGRGFGCHGARIEDPERLGDVLREAFAAISEGVPAVVDALITRDPAQMLPGIDRRTALDVS